MTDSQVSGTCPPRARRQGHPRRFTVIHGAAGSAPDLCGPPTLPVWPGLGDLDDRAVFLRQRGGGTAADTGQASRLLPRRPVSQRDKWLPGTRRRHSTYASSSDMLPSSRLSHVILVTAFGRPRTVRQLMSRSSGIMPQISTIS
jgi:hypothetical protein